MKRVLHDGKEDGLDPLATLDLSKVNNFEELLQHMSRTAFGGRNLGEALDVLEKMISDSDCKIVFTISGAMTIAKMGKIVCDMMDEKIIDMMISTGAIMAHGLTEGIGCLHYKYNPDMDDKQLYYWGYNRVYDTLEKEESLTEAEHIISDVLKDYDFNERTCSHSILKAVGKYLYEKNYMPSILGAAYKNEIPVYIPAFTDSEFGLNVATHLMAQNVKNKNASIADVLHDVPVFDPFVDLYDYTQRICNAKRIGIITIGGGVPRNWGQQVGPFIDIINLRIGTNLTVPRFHYGVRICPEPVHWGGLSGCTYSEGISWGKFVPKDEGGRFAEVLCDATIAWPVLMKAIFEKIKR